MSRYGEEAPKQIFFERRIPKRKCIKEYGCRQHLPNQVERHTEILGKKRENENLSDNHVTGQLILFSKLKDCHKHEPIPNKRNNKNE